ncbi:MAG: hypothetical protein JJ863_34895 [Deltaproteobacteria bacterium]|nr:hypothetical protein [Deltaproteobacteria bacterium]
MNMLRITTPLTLALCLALAGCGDDGRPSTMDGAVFRPDEDGDTIANQDEGSSAGVDTDGDGTEDWLDMDSDNDGIFDIDEAGDSDPATPPVDSEGDGIPDFQDFDSDNNGIPDVREGTGDNDGDGLLDYADEDDDNDGLRDEEELMGRVDFPRDVDDDGIPDFRDPDSDNDTILDGTERLDRDTDGDGVPDREDLDSDNDGISDADEAGDSDLSTLPIDTDGDRIPDYRDSDSDNDGLPDASEAAAGTDPRLADSDDDGVSDLIEVGAGTDALDPADNPRANGDFVFVVPFEEPARPSRDTLLFRTNVQLADVYFLWDTTGSMATPIRETRDRYIEIVDRLTCDDYDMTCSSDGDCEFAPAGAVCSAGGRCIENPETSGCIADLWTGVGSYEDGGEHANLLSLQPIPSMTQMAFPEPPFSGGTEALFESSACSADRAYCPAGAGCTVGGIGCPSFRPDAIRILMAITDEPNECSSCSPGTALEVGRIISDQNIVFAGIRVDGSNPEDAFVDLSAIATAAGSFDSTGAPLVFRAPDASGDPAAFVDGVVTTINEVLQNIPLYVTIDPRDEPGDSGNALQFIEHLETNITRPGCALLDELADVNPRDGHTETFPEVPPGERVCWDLVVRQNRTVPATDEPQLFRATLTVTGNGSPLDRREVFFLVPPKIDDPMGEF